MNPEDRFFQQLTQEELWKRYCGFLDLSVDQFMEVQEQLLLDQVDRVWASQLGRKVMGEQKPGSVADFRRLVPLTTYKDYEPYLGERREDVLACTPEFWCHSSGRMGEFKWFPHSSEALEHANRACLSILLLASTTQRGTVNIAPGFRWLLMLPPPPYMSGSLVDSMSKHVTFRAIPPRAAVAALPFQHRVAAGFQMGLRDGVDVIGAIASVLVKMGEKFEEQSRKTKLTASVLHPSVLSRLVRARLRARRERRPMLPRDLWPSRAIVTSGMDTAIYRNAIVRYWGSDPCEFYACAEGMVLATQGINKKGLYLFPDMAFYEFIPEPEVRKWQADNSYTPTTVLYNEVKQGELYEVVITHFYGMPLLRYRMNDLVKFTGLQDRETGVTLPHMQFQRRVGETIDLAALARIDERTLWQAIADTGLHCVDWVATKEYHGEQAYLRLHIELRESASSDSVASMVDDCLKRIDVDYGDLESYLGLQPIKVTILNSGTFDRYADRQRAAGADLAHIKPPHVNASEEAVRTLLELSQELVSTS